MVLADRAERIDRVGTLENGPHPNCKRVLTVCEEEFWNLRYARCDLSALTA